MCNSTHKIIGCATLTRQDHTIAQTRELACTRAVIPEVINRGCFNTCNIAYDYRFDYFGSSSR